MSIGKKIRELRKIKDISQEELGKRIGTHLTNIGRYERDAQIPSADIIKKLAEVFNVSADYLLFEDNRDNISVKVKDEKVIEYLEKIESLPPEDKEVIFTIIDSIVIRNEVNQIGKKTTRRTSVDQTTQQKRRRLI